MGKQTESEFYNRLNEIDGDDADDADDGFGWLIAHCICAISGGVVGFLIGYFLGAM